MNGIQEVDGSIPFGSTISRSHPRLAIIATGSRGDVQPQVALAQRLQLAGYEVRFATHRSFAPLVRAGGLEHVPLAGDSEKFFAGRGGVVFRERLTQPGAALDFAERFLAPFIRRFLAECVAACENADAIFYWPPSLVGPSLAEALGIPCFAVATYPLPHCRTRAFANPWHTGSVAGQRGGTANERTWAHGEPLWGRLFREEVTRWRRTLGLGELSPAAERRRLRRLPHLLGFSPAVLPRPDDWPATMHATGYWFLDLASTFTPPPALLDFLAAGPPPVSIGFGSMASRDPAAMTEMAIAALRRAGRRAILLTGWGGLSQADLPDDVFKLEAAPHDWLFPRVAAVVHHGGAGTTAAALRAGVPVLTVPFGFDQHLWGQQVHRLGAGVAPIPQGELTVERMAEALGALTTDARYRARAAALAAVIQAEDGTGTAAALVGRYLGGFKRRR